MTGSNGQANGSATASAYVPEVGTALGVPRISDHPERFCLEEIRRYTAQLEIQLLDAGIEILLH